MLEQPVGVNGQVRRDREQISARDLIGFNTSSFPNATQEDKNEGKLNISSIAQANIFDPPSANSQQQVRSVRKLAGQLAVRNNLKVQDNASFQSNYEEFVQRTPASPLILTQLPAKNNNTAVPQNSSTFKKINQRNQSNDPFLLNMGGVAGLIENTITAEEDSPNKKYTESSSHMIKTEQSNSATVLPANNKQQYAAAMPKYSDFKGDGKKPKLMFAEDDEYCYFVKGSIINENSKHCKDSGTPKHSRTAKPGKSILKLVKKDDINGAKARGQGKKTTFDITIDIPKNERGMEDTTISPNTADNSNSSGKKSGDTSDTEKLLDRDCNSNLLLLMNAPLINTRGRSSILLPANAGKLAQGQKRNSLSSFRKEQLEKYEKRDYMRRSSDINKLIEFQNSQANVLKRAAQFLCEMLIKLIACIAKLRVISTTRPSSYSCISNSTHLFFLLFLNMTLIGLLIFLYPIIQNFQDGSSLFDTIFGSFQTSTHLAGHCFLVLFCLAVFRLSMQINDFSLDKMERQSFKLVFAELKWNIPTSQAFVMTEKSKLIDQILENIDDNDTDKLVNQIMSIIIGQILLSVSNLVILYYILDDSKLLSVISQDSYPFAGRLIVAVTISILLLLNSLAVKVFFSFFELVAFTFYERTEFYILYFNQMFILAIYQIKILGYFSDIFNISFVTYSMKDAAHISFPNYALALSEIGFYCMEAILTFLLTRSKTVAVAKIFPQQTPKVQNISEELDKQIQMQGHQNSAVEIAQSNILNGGVGNNEETPANLNGLENNFSRLSADFTSKQRLGIKRKTFQDDEGKFAATVKGGDSDSQGRIAKTAFRHMRKCIFIFSFNFLILNGALISPCTFILGLAVNAILTIHFSFEQKIVRRHVSYLDFNQFNSQTSVFGLASLLLSAIFNGVIGFYLKNTQTPSSSLFKAEFYYIYEQGTVSQIISIISLPYVLYPAIIFLSALLFQSSYQYKKTYTVLNETYANLRKSQFQAKTPEIAKS